MHPLIRSITMAFYSSSLFDPCFQFIKNCSAADKVHSVQIKIRVAPFESGRSQKASSYLYAEKLSEQVSSGICEGFRAGGSWFRVSHKPRCFNIFHLIQETWSFGAVEDPVSRESEFLGFAVYLQTIKDEPPRHKERKEDCFFY